jgi:hypothetical protein
MRRLPLRATWLLLAAVPDVSCTLAPATSPVGDLSIRSKDANAQASEITRWILQLQSSSCAEWREAQVQLARFGREALGPLNDWTSRASKDVRQRAGDVVEVALRGHTTFGDLERTWPNLAAIARPEVERAAQLALPFVTADVYDFGEEGLHPLGVRRASDVQVALEELQKLGGFAVPIGEALCKSDKPVARAYGILLLSKAAATLHAPLVRSLAGDVTAIPERGSDWFGHTTIAEVAAESPLLEPRRGPFNEFESYVAHFGNDLVYGIRRTSGARQARTFDEWWAQARPVWQEWWGLSPSCRSPDRQAWIDWQTGKRGYRLRGGRDPSGKGSLRVDGYDQGQCQVLRDGKEIAHGKLPFSMDDIPTPSSVHVIVTLSNGNVVEEDLFLFQGAADVFTVVPRIPSRE